MRTRAQTRDTPDVAVVGARTDCASTAASRPTGPGAAVVARSSTKITRQLAPCDRLRAMGALTDLWKSERGLLTALILIAAGILAGLSVLTADQWMDFTKFIFVTYVGGKTVTGAVAILKGSKADAAVDGALVQVATTEAPATEVKS